MKKCPLPTAKYVLQEIYLFEQIESVLLQGSKARSKLEHIGVKAQKFRPKIVWL